MSNGATLPAKANTAANTGSVPAIVDTATTLKDGDTLPRLLGRHVLLRLMVRGGMGEVFLATTIGIEGAERPCVVKRIRREYKSDPSFHARFLDEARVQSQLDDPGVARIVEAAVDEHGDPFVVVEYVEGRSMADVRSRLSRLGKPLPWADAVAVTLEIASALAHCHERTGADGAPLGIVHRDLSPQNVMVGFSGDVKLIDFGTARGDNRRCHTVSGTVLAKPGYVAPEVARGDSATPRADVYALGVMFWELVSGRRFLEGDATEHVANITAGRLRPAKLTNDPMLAQLGDGPIPAELDRIVAWLTEPVASQRCATARSAAQALVGLLSSAPRRPVEERGVRARVKAMLARLYPTEPAASRVEFARLVSKARRVLATELAEISPTGPMVKKNDATPEPQTQIPDGLPGTRYRLIRRLGEGAMGVVYEAEHVDLGRRVAVKVLQGKHSASPDFVARFRREARAIAGLSHPNLVHVYDFGQTMGDPATSEWGGRLFFVMERLEGETLDEFLDRERGIDWRDGCELAIKTCRALEAAHSAGLVHRDLKPANLFLTYAGRRPASLSEVGVKLLDFGVAKEMGSVTSASEAVGADDPSLSKAGMIFGTPETMSPEQVGGEDVDHRADVYALGCVIFQMLTGKSVFDAPSPVLMMSCHLREAPKPLRVAAPNRGIPEAVEKVVMRALAKDPKDRFADAGEMREALEEACYGGFFVDSQLPSAALMETMAREESFEVVIDKSKIEETGAIARPRRRAPGLLAFATLAACAILTVAAHRAHKIPDMRGFVPQSPFAHKTQALRATLPSPMTGIAPSEPAEVIEKSAEKAQIAPPKPAVASMIHLNAPTSPLSSVESPVIAKPAAAAAIEAKIAKGETEEALVMARSAKEDGSASSAEAWAHAAFAAGKLAEAHDACVTWIARHADPKALEPRLADARALRDSGRIAEAKTRLEESAKLHPESTEVRVMLRDLELLEGAKPSPAHHLKKKKGAQKLLG